MTDTRLVRLEQIAVVQVDDEPYTRLRAEFCKARKFWETIGVTPQYLISCRAIGDATGGDVFQATGPDGAIVDELKRAKWPHMVQVEVVNG